MTELATAWIQLVPSTKGMKAALEKEFGQVAGPAGEKAGDQAGQGFSKRFESSTGRSLGDWSKSALIGAAAFGAGLYATANAAGNLEAALAANVQVLGDASEAVQDFASGSVKSVGLSERATLQASTAFGQLGKVAGLAGDDLAGFSVDMVTLAADLAAFADVPADMAVQDLRAAFAGSTETMQKYNVFLNETELKSALFRQTGEKVTGVLTAQQRVLATHAALLEQTGDIQGQAAREADGFQRAQDNLKATLENTAASIGESTLPAVSAMINAATAGIGAVGGLNDATGGLVGGLLLVGTVGLGAAGSVAFVADKASKAIDGFQAMSVASQRAALGMGILAAAAVAGFVIWDGLRRKQEEMKARTDEVARALNSQFRETLNVARASSGASGEIDGLAAANKALSNALTSAGGDGEKLTESLGELGIHADDAVGILRSFEDDPKEALRALAEQSGLTADEADKLAGIVAGTDEEWRVLTRTAEELGGEFVATALAMEEIQDQEEKTNLNDITRSWLATTAAGKDLTEQGQKLAASLVEQAEAAATGEDGAVDYTAAYQEYGRLVGELTPEQQKLVAGTKDLADASGDAADAGAGLNKVSTSTIELLSEQERGFKEAADQASALSDAFGDIIGRSIDLDEAQQNLYETAQALTESILENGTTLDIATEKGRANRDMVREHAEAILGNAEAMVTMGHSNEEAATAVEMQRQALVDQMTQLGFTEAEVDAYLTTLGLTPENVTTSIELANQQAAKTRVEEWLDDLEEIPADKLTELNALIAQNDYIAAENWLNLLARERIVQLRARVSGGGDLGKYGIPAAESAEGRYVSGFMLSTLGERGPEAVLPLTNPARMRTLLADERILGPVLDALPKMPVAHSGGRDRGLFGDVTIATTESTDSVKRTLDTMIWEHM